MIFGRTIIILRRDNVLGTVWFHFSRKYNVHIVRVPHTGWIRVDERYRIIYKKNTFLLFSGRYILHAASILYIIIIIISTSIVIYFVDSVMRLPHNIITCTIQRFTQIDTVCILYIILLLFLIRFYCSTVYVYINIYYNSI
jgi:hypothetical protein